VAHEYLRREGFMDEDLQVERDREQWYRLSVGAHVTEEFEVLGDFVRALVVPRIRLAEGRQLHIGTHARTHTHTHTQ
jgi:hypothetical protein